MAGSKHDEQKELLDRLNRHYTKASLCLPKSSCPYWQYKWPVMPSTVKERVTHWSDFVGESTGRVAKAFRVGLKMDDRQECGNAEVYCEINGFELQRKLGVKVTLVSFQYEVPKEKVKELFGDYDSFLNPVGGADDSTYSKQQLFTTRQRNIPHEVTSLTFKLYLAGAVDQFVYSRFDPLLGQQLWMAAKEKNQTDFLFQVGQKSFPAHKFVLAARSPVFAAMFSTGMVESRTGQVHIDDVDPDVFEQFLRFIYTGEIDQPVTNELGIVADKYGVPTLSALCAGIRAVVIADEDVDDDSFKATDGFSSMGLGAAATGFCELVNLPLEQQSSDDWIPYPASQSENRDLNKASLSFQTELAYTRFTRIAPYFGSPRVEDVYFYRMFYLGNNKEAYALNQFKMEPKKDFPKFIRIMCALFPKSLGPEHPNFTFAVHCKMGTDEDHFGWRDSLFPQQLLTAAVNEDWTDVKIQVGDRTFPAHRALLASRCPSLLVTSEDNFIRVDHLDASVFEELFYFVYTGMLKTFPPLRNLLEAAKFYQMDTLVNIICRHREEQKQYLVQSD